MTFEFGPNEEISSLGEYFRRVRLLKELDLDECARVTKIHRRFLEAIEEDDYSQLPDVSYAELFQKAYAEYLGVNLDEVLLRLPERTRNSGDVEEEKPRTNNASRRDIAAMSTANAGGIRRTRTHMVAIFAISLVIIVVLATFIWLNDERTARLPAPAAGENGQAVMGQSGARAESELLNIMLVGLADCPLEISIDGDSVIHELLPANDTMYFAMQDSVRIKAAHANRLQVYCNSLPLKVAESTDTTALQFTLTRDGYVTLVDSARMIL